MSPHTTPHCPVLYNGKVRLQNGAYPSLGRVPLYWAVGCGVWRHGQEEADKVCRQLGYTGADRFGFKLRCMGISKYTEHWHSH